MAYWREEGRPTIWTREGKLVYNDVLERDPVLAELRLVFKKLIHSTPVKLSRNDELAAACKAWVLRKEELKR